MIYITIDSSYEEDYHMISEVVVNLKDEKEKDRINQVVIKRNMIGALVDVDNDLSNRIARLLEVEVELIDLDTNEIDYM